MSGNEGRFKMWFCKGCLFNDYYIVTLTYILFDNAYIYYAEHVTFINTS